MPKLKNKDSLKNYLTQMHNRANKKAWSENNKKRKSQGLKPQPYNPNYNYWI